MPVVNFQPWSRKIRSQKYGVDLRGVSTSAFSPLTQYGINNPVVNEEEIFWVHDIYN